MLLVEKTVEDDISELNKGIAYVAKVARSFADKMDELVKLYHLPNAELLARTDEMIQKSNEADDIKAHLDDCLRDPKVAAYYAGDSSGN